MGGILSKQVEVPPRGSLDTPRQAIKAPPEPRGSSVHLKLFERALLRRVRSLFDEEVEGAGL